MPYLIYKKVFLAVTFNFFYHPSLFLMRIVIFFQCEVNLMGFLSCQVDWNLKVRKNWWNFDQKTWTSAWLLIVITFWGVLGSCALIYETSAPTFLNFSSLEFLQPFHLTFDIFFLIFYLIFYLQNLFISKFSFHVSL